MVTFTEEQIKENRKYVEEVCQEVAKKAESIGARWAVVIFWDILANCLAKRVAYFEECYDCSVWVDLMDKEFSAMKDMTYQKDMTYHIYRG